jgi:GxxExxY protein
LEAEVKESCPYLVEFAKLQVMMMHGGTPLSDASVSDVTVAVDDVPEPALSMSKRARPECEDLRVYVERWVQRWRAAKLQLAVVAAAERVYAELGWGWSESTYREALVVELQRDGLAVQAEVVHPVCYRGQPLSHVSMRMDLVVSEQLVVELKACAPTGEAMNKAAQQCARYLHNVPHLRSGLVLNFPDKAEKAVAHIQL